MNERQLLAFKYVLQYGTVTNAADLLHVTQSAASQMITNLEDELGFQLFERRRGKVASSTPQGRRFLPKAEAVLNAINKAQRAANELKGMSFGSFRVASTHGLAMSLVPNVLARFSKEHPEAALSLQTHHSTEVCELVAARIFDVGICEQIELEAWPELDYELFSIPCSFVCRRDDPLAQLSRITPRDLIGRAIIAPYDQYPTGVSLHEAFLEEGVAWRPHISANSYGAACQIARLTDAVTWADQFTLKMLSDSLLCVRPFAPEVFLKIAILKAPQERESPQVTDMISLLREEIEAVCP